MLSKFFSVEKKHVWTLSFMVVAAATGLLAAFVLSTEALELAKDSNAVLPCNINSALNCAAVGSHPTAHIFGFPNAFVGMMTLPVMLTIAAAALMGAKFPKPFMFIAQLGAVAGAAFALWMFYVSYTVIQVLCPWCLTTDLAMLVLLVAMTRYNIQEENLFLSKKANMKAQRFIKQGFDVLAGVIVIVLAVAAIIVKFGQALYS